MFKSNPHFNQYYGLIHQIKRKTKKLKRTQCSNEKIQYSKKSFSQDSHSDSQISIHRKTAQLQPFLNKRQNDAHHKFQQKINSPESPKEENILDLFKRKDLQAEQNFKKSIDLHPQARSKKYTGINYNQNTSNKKVLPVNSGPQYELGEYFGQSIKLKNIKSDKNSSRSRSLRDKSHKSPLKRILKAKSRQQLYTPMQKMLNVIKQQEKARQKWIQNEKTLKHVNLFKSFNQLNQTHMNYPGLKHVCSQKNYFQLQPESHRKKKKNLNALQLHHQQSSNSKQYHPSTKNDSPRKKNLKRMKSESEIVFQGNHRTHEKPNKISSSKIKKYFNKKEEAEKDNMKMKHLLEHIGTKNKAFDLRKVQSEKALSYADSQFINDSSQVSSSLLSKDPNNQSNSKVSSSRNHQQTYSNQKIPYHSGQDDSDYQQGSVCYEYSDYGFQVPQQGSPYRQQQKNQNKNFQKTPKKNAVEFYNVPLDLPQSPAGQMIDQIMSFEESKFKEFINESEMNSNEINSMASIEDRMPVESQKRQKESYLSSQRSQNSLKLSDCKINVYEPSRHYQFERQVSINTPAYHHNLIEKKPKQSIISKLKKDIERQKLKSSKSSKVIESQVSQKPSQLSSPRKNKLPSSYLSNGSQQKKPNIYQSSVYTEQQNNNFTNMIMKIESKNSNIHELSKLINTERDYQPPAPPQLKEKISLKESISRLKKSTASIKEKSKVEKVKLHQDGHGVSEFQSLVNERKESSLSGNSQKTIKIESMISSNKVRSSKKEQSSEQFQSLSQLTSSKKSSSCKESEKQISSSAQKQEEDKKIIKFIKVVKKTDPIPTSVIPKMEESNLQSVTDSYQTESLASSQTMRFPKSVSPQKAQYSKANSIKEEDKSENEGSQYESSGDMSSSSSVYSESQQKNSQSIKKRVSDSEYSQSSQSRTVTNNQNKNSRLSSSEQNLNLNSKSSFSLSSSSPQANNILNSKTSSMNSSTHNNKFANANNFNSLPKNDSNLFKKKKNFAEYTLNDVARYIEEHEFRIEAFCFYIDNSRTSYEEDYELQKIELLSFLMLKKNIFELNRAISALQGKGENVFNLTDIEILDEVLEDYLDREEIKQQLSNMVKEVNENLKELKQTYQSLEKKYNGEKGFNLALKKDDFSSEIVKKLGQQLNTLYEKWQQNKSDGDRVTAKKLCAKLQKRMAEIIELIFLSSEIDGKKIKPFELNESEIQFRSYYEKWFERIIETIQYFDSKSKCYSN